MTDEKDSSELSTSPKIHFEPIVKLPEVEIKTLEEDEDEMLKLRGKLFRFDFSEEPPEWKERGTGEVKILKHTERNICRVLMRRDKTLKICANHYISPGMELKPNCGSDRAWVWSVPVDFADEEAKPELLAIRFANAENAQKFKTVFEDCQKISPIEREEPEGALNTSTEDSVVVPEKENTQNGSKDEDTTNQSQNEKELTDKLGDMSVKEKDNKESSESSESPKKDTL